MIDDPKVFWGVKFYNTLFELQPALEPLFANKSNQAEILVLAMDGIINLLSVYEQSQLVSLLQTLAQRHVQYQAKPEHYESVGLAIIQTHSKMLGESLTSEMKSAWIELWSFICTVMIPEQINHLLAR